jgi:hypothetical protein
MKKNYLDFLGLPPLEEPEQMQSMERPPLPPEIVQYLQAKKEQAPLLDQFSNEEYEKAKQAADERNSDLGLAQFAAGAGAALARRDPSDVNAAFDKIRERNKDETVGEFNRKKAQAISDIDTKNKIDNNDQNSAKSKMLQAQISKLYPNAFTSDEIATFTLADQENILKPLELKAKLDARKEEMSAMRQQREMDRQDRALNNNLRKEEITLKRQEVSNDKLNKLQTQFGIANTEQDAKTLKDAYEEKANFDSKINEMIKLREDNNGGALFDREAVARGKQLSKDLLLSYKNMAKLGVLSASDEKIINAIIPADPLEYNSPLAAIQGQDPILHQLKSFKKDSDKDFSTKVATRIRGNPQQSSNFEKSSFPRTVTKGKQSATVSNEAELKEAKAEGWN